MTPLVVNRNIDHGEEGSLVDELLDRHQEFDGVFVSGCSLANSLYDKARERGIKIPEELQIVSYDGEFSIDEHTTITTLEQPLDLMAEKCVELIIKRIKNETDYELINTFDCRFIKGETTK